MGEDSVKRLIKKSKLKPSSRPSSGNKKKPTTTSTANNSNGFQGFNSNE
jgi:hypothetical protein